jgi:hypothetical protein
MSESVKYVREWFPCSKGCAEHTLPIASGEMMLPEENAPFPGNGAQGNIYCDLATQ